MATSAVSQQGRLHGFPARRVGAHVIVNGDSLDVMAAMPAGSVDVVVTSPQYNIGIRYRDDDDMMTEGDYLAWFDRMVAAVRRVLRDDGSFFLNVAGSSTLPWLPFEIAVRLRPRVDAPGRGFVIQNEIAWIKSITVRDVSRGHFKHVGGSRYLHRMHEKLFHLTKAGDVALDRKAVGTPYQDKSNIRRRGHAADLRCRGNTWFVPYETVKDQAGKHRHPAGFPLELPRMCIRLHGRPAALVLDPFVGAGTTVCAAHLEGCVGIGVERDPVYASTAADRLAAIVAPGVG